MSMWIAPAGLHIAYGEPDDAPAIAAIHAEGFYRGWPVSEFEAYLADPKNTPVYVATDARRRLAGFAVVRRAGAEAELLTVAVGRRMRAKGVGQALMRAIFDDLRHSPVRSVFLEVEQTNVPAVRLYKGLGFLPVGTRQGYYARPDGTAATALVMRADLG